MKQRISPIRRVPRAALVMAALALSACAEQLGPTAPKEETPSDLERVSSETFDGAPGLPLLDSVSVRALGEDGSPAEGVTVAFAVTGGGGEVSASRVETGPDGRATVRWVLGPDEGENTLEATTEASGVPLGFTATAARSAVASMEVISDGSSSLPVGCPVTDPLRVRVLNGAGEPVSGALVLFRRPDSPPMEGWVVESDANGEAALEWRLSSPNEQVMVETATPGASASFEVSGVPVAPNGFGTSGNRIYGPDCEVHRFVGVARPGLQWWPDDFRLADAAEANQEFATMRSWGANVVRIPLYQRYWLEDITLEGVLYEATEYQRIVRETVDRVNEAGMAVILELHNSDRGDPNFPDDVADIQQMADVAHSIPFWKQVAEQYRDNGQVLFQLYTEPNQIDWDTWRNGGMIPAGETFPPQSSGVAFEAAGMQDLYDTVRAAGANNLVIVNGMHWGYNLSGLPEYALDGYNIAYATHPYDYPDKQPGAWWADWGFATELYPVIIAEFGDYTCNENGYYDAVLNFADEYQLSWVAWAWFAPPSDREDQICGFPSLITDWDGTPSPTGEIVRARMQSYGN